MKETRIFEQLVLSNLDFHPIIRDSRLSIGDKLHLQELLDNKFKGDFRALIQDMLEYAVMMEEYEFAAIIRDELQNK
jgi:hypothetical protein